MAGTNVHNLKYPVSYEEKISYWYRTNPSTSGSSSGTTGNNPAMGQKELNPGQVSQDRVFVTVLVTAPSVVEIQIGDHAPTVLRACTAGINHFSAPFNGQTGLVKMAVMRGGHEIAATTGPAITEQCVDGKINWNAVVGSSNGTDTA